MQRLFLLIVAVGLAGWYVSGDSKKTSTSSATTSPSCKTDWKLCTDNADMANNYGEYYLVGSRCKRAANDLAKYGTPEWPWLTFGTFKKGTDYVSTGVVMAIEDDAKFENGFGGKVRSRVECVFDFNKKEVVNVSIKAR